MARAPGRSRAIVCLRFQETAIARRILYLAPDFDVPSWGVGLIYGHVDLLRELGVEAWVLHESADFVPSWLPSAAETPRVGRAESGFTFHESDVLIVPEVDALRLPELEFPGQAWLFVQGTLPLLQAVPNASSLEPLGYRGSADHDAAPGHAGRALLPPEDASGAAFRLRSLLR